MEEQNTEQQSQETSLNDTTEKKMPESKRMVAGILGIFLGSIGIHKFYLGYTTEGVIWIVASVFVWVMSLILSCLIIGAFTFWIPFIIAFVEGLIYITKSDEEFIETYQLNKRAWF